MFMGSYHATVTIKRNRKKKESIWGERYYIGYQAVYRKMTLKGIKEERKKI